jgi:hypothetical protein
MTKLRKSLFDQSGQPTIHSSFFSRNAKVDFLFNFAPRRPILQQKTTRQIIGAQARRNIFKSSGDKSRQ